MASDTGGKDFAELQERLGLSFSDIALLRQAFTHRSYLNEHRGEHTEHNERLEFLGDAVLELAVTKFLYSEFPDKTEGDLTAYRAALVNTNTLAAVSAKLGMNDYLYLSKGEAKDTGRARQYILANTFESLVGAIYLDRGYEAAQHFIATHIFPLTEEVVGKRLWQDAKSRFQEASQEQVSVTPTYKVMEESGPDHDKHFVVGVYLGNELVGKGDGKSKQEAEQKAAADGLTQRGW